MSDLQTALARVRGLWDRGDYRNALKTVAAWSRLGDARDDIRTGWAAVGSPDMYREMGRDPDALYVAGLDAVARRYDLPPHDATGLPNG